MTTWVALLRGVNVGGRGTLPMADLRRLALACGFVEVRTYIQSGNLIFTSDDADAVAVSERLRTALRDGAALDVRVALRTADALRGVVAANPFPDADPAHLHVTFLLDPATAGSIDADRYLPERVAIGTGELYLHLPGGMGRSRLATELGRRADLAGTTRNWRTVTALLAMVGGTD